MPLAPGDRVRTRKGVGKFVGTVGDSAYVGVAGKVERVRMVDVKPTDEPLTESQPTDPHITLEEYKAKERETMVVIKKEDVGRLEDVIPNLADFAKPLVRTTLDYAKDLRIVETAEGPVEVLELDINEATEDYQKHVEFMSRGEASLQPITLTEGEATAIDMGDAKPRIEIKPLDTVEVDDTPGDLEAMPNLTKEYLLTTGVPELTRLLDNFGGSISKARKAKLRRTIKEKGGTL